MFLFGAVELLLPFFAVRPTQSMIYVPLLVNIFEESVLLIIQYKHSKFCPDDFILQKP